MNQIVSTVSVPVSTHSSVEWQAIDESFIRHITDRYWEWKRFSESLSDLTVYEHPDYILREVRQEQRPSFLIQYREHGELRGVAALVPKLFKTWTAGTIGLHRNLRGYRLAGKTVTVSDRAGIPQSLLEELGNALGKLNSPFILVEDLETDSSLHRALSEELPSGFKTWAPNGLQPRLKFQLPEQQEAYWAKFSSKTRSTLRRKVKKAGNLRLERITAPEQVADFLQHAHAISRHTWQASMLGLRIRNDARELEVFTEMASLGRLRCYLLFQNETPVSFVVGNQFNGLYNYEEPGYDQNYADISPGQIILCQMIEDFYAWNRPEWFDFGGGDAPYKQLFATHQSQSGSLWITRNNHQANLLMGWIKSCRYLRSIARTVLKQSGAFTRLRQSVRRRGSQASEDNS